MILKATWQLLKLRLKRGRDMLERLQNLLSVKSIVTIALCIVFCILSINGAINAEQFLTIFTVVISFYFGVQAEKKNNIQ